MVDIKQDIKLLQRLIATPSQSRNEAETADIIYHHLEDLGIKPQRIYNNVYAFCDYYDAAKPTLLLNSHHDTVKPASSYTRDPYQPLIEDGCLYGLGSNDAGASVVSLIHVFNDLRSHILSYNLLLAITAEEEVGGEHGMRAFLKHLEDKKIKIDAALVGEPTEMQPAIAERGLVVLDCLTQGITGHAARNEGVNAIYRAISDIEKLRNFNFENKSDVLGDISLNITQIEAGWQHNAIPDVCKWVVDVRTTDAYTNAQTAEILQNAVDFSILTPRSTRVQASVIETSHPLVSQAIALGRKPFVSPTTSDMSLMHKLPSMKMGPGRSQRSHQANEFVRVDEIAESVEIYTNLLINLKL